MSDPLEGARILLVGNLPPPFGGIAVHVGALRERLLESGARVRVLDVGARGAPLAGTAGVKGPLGLAAQLARHAATGHLVHVHVSGHTPKSWMVALAGAAARSPIAPPPVLTVHSGLLPRFLALGEGRRRLVASVAGAYARVVAVNEPLAGALRDLGLSPARLRVAPAFPGRVEPGRPPPGFEAARAARRPLLACMMAPSPIYGARVLFAALPVLAQALPGLGVCIFGPAPREALRELARRHGVEDRVELLGELSRAEGLAVVAGSDLFVRPTLADGDALSVREALALGRPVVASDVGFRPPGTAVFTAGDPVDLADKVIRALGPREALEVEPGDGLGAVLSIYRELLGRPAARA